MKGVCLDYTMPCGKNKGKSIQWIFDNGRSYFNFLFDSDYVNQKCRTLKSELIRVMKES